MLRGHWGSKTGPWHGVQNQSTCSLVHIVYHCFDVFWSDLIISAAQQILVAISCSLRNVCPVISKSKQRSCCVASTITAPYCKSWTLVNIGFSAISGDSTRFCFGLKSTELCRLFEGIQLQSGFRIEYTQLMPKRNRSGSLVAVQFFQRKLIEFPWEHSKRHNFKEF